MRDCHSYEQNRMHGWHPRQLKLFYPKGPLEYVIMDILVSPPNTEQADQIVIMMTDRFTKLTKKIPTTITKATTVARIDFEHWVTNYGMPSELLTDIGS